MSDLSTYNFVELYCRLNFTRRQQWHHTNLSMPSLDSDKEHEANREANRIKAAELKDYCDRIKAELMFSGSRIKKYPKNIEVYKPLNKGK